MGSEKAIYLRTAREQCGLTQEQLERLSGIAQNTISRLESDRRAQPVFTTVVRLAQALGVDPLALRFGPDPRRRPGGRQKAQVA